VDFQLVVDLLAKVGGCFDLRAAKVASARPASLAARLFILTAKKMQHILVVEDFHCH
jgi:hypothetical protein